MPPAFRNLLRRLSVRRVASTCGVFGAAFAIGRGAAPEYDVSDLATALSQASGGVVAPADIRWEPSGGIVSDVVYGRWALFLSAETARGPRDVWRARVRLTPEGRPLDVAGPHNLTQTPLGDDHALVIRDGHAAFATYAFGQEQSVTALDLIGEGAQNTTTSLADRAMAYITNVQQTGSGSGVGRIDVTLEQPARAVGLAMGETSLAIDLADDGSARHATLDLAKGELVSIAPGLRDERGLNERGLHAEASRHLPKRFVFWAVDTVRAVPSIGPAPIAWLEEKVFALRDDAKQLAFKMHGSDPSDTLANAATVTPPAIVLDTSQTAIDSAHWPPSDLPTIWKTPEPGEGEWLAPKLPWLRKVATADGTTPPSFFRTFVRPDQERPYTKVILVAMDMRQLDLDMEAGSEDPKPLTGSHGPGRLPRDPKIYQRVVGAFNGAFKTEHGNYGMMVHKRVLLPPQPGAASVVVLADARVGLGTWGNTTNVTGVRGVADEDILSFRQNLDPLVDQGEVNPTKRALWGYTLPGNGTQTERSGICVTNAGHLVYAWGDDVSATMLGKAMLTAGCIYGIHLDMNPHHTGFLFTTIDDVRTHKFKSEALSPLMEISPDRYIDWAAKDFFYVALHDPTPPAIASAAPWTADGGAQPAPTWMPGVWSTRVDGRDGRVDLVDVESQRATWRIRAGLKEPDAKTGAAPLHELSDEDAHRVLFSAGLGTSLEKHPAGLATDGKLVLQVGELARSGTPSAVLVARADGSLAILRDAELTSIAPHVDAAEVPLLLDGGNVLATDRGGNPLPRSALGITESGRVVLARGLVGSDAALGDALKAAGCTRAVVLDRGLRGAQHFDRAGTSSPPRAHYEETTLFAVAVPMKPRGFRFDATEQVAQAAKPK